MEKLTISYDAEARRAILEASDPEGAWPHIVRACTDHSDQTKILGVRSLSIPWWQFLSCREAVGYHVGLHDISVEFDTQSRALLERARRRTDIFKNADAVEGIETQNVERELSRKGFLRNLTAEQARNVSKLSALPSGATFSVPGAGKTTEALAVFFLKAAPTTRLLVVAPKNAFAAWERELGLCVPTLSNAFVRLVGGGRRIGELFRSEPKPRFMLITYHQLQYVRNELAEQISEDTWIFLDESHRIKRGLDGKIGGTLLSISHIPNFKLLLSGTPMPNSVSDLVPQFEFLFPEIEVTADNVRGLIQPFYVRTTKQELHLRPPDRHLVSVPMGEAQRRLYRLVRSEAARQAELALRDRGKLRALGRSVIRLLQIASNPALLTSSGNLPAEILAELLAEEDSPKLDYACVRARELAEAGKKVVIWTTFVENVEVIARRLADLGADFIHGGVDAGSDEEEDTREWKIKKFHIPEVNWVLVANPAACGEGISLHEVCHHAIYVDRNYNAAQYLQSEDRIHRLGLAPQQVTTVEILCCPDSIDESVNERLSAKVRRMGEVLNDEHLNIDPVSFDPIAINDNEIMDEDDVRSLVAHLAADT